MSDYSRLTETNRLTGEVLFFPSDETGATNMAGELVGGERTYVCERQAGIVANLLREFFGEHG